MVKEEEHDLTNKEAPKKELYFEAELRIRCSIAVALDIRDRLRPGSARSELFRGTCFGQWLDVQSTSNDTALVHLMLQTQYIPVGDHDALYFRVGGRELRFGPEDFFLITGLKFGHYQLGQGRMQDMTFKDRVFGHLQTRLKVFDIKNVFNNRLDKLSDIDAVRLCLLMLLEVGFMGHESKSLVDPIILELVEDLESWNTFPWGSYVWKVVHEQLHNALGKRSARITNLPTTKQFSYALQGFIWAFKIWIFEVFPYAKFFAIKHGGIPRAFSWGKNTCIKWGHALPLVMDATMSGFEPLLVLTPTPAECATDWWRASHQYFGSFANNSLPPLKKARLSPPHLSGMVNDLLVDNIADTTTIPVEDDISDTTNLPLQDIANTTSHRTMVMRENMENTNLEERVNELWSARRSHCIKTEMPTTSDLFGLSEHLEDHVVAGKVSSEGDIVCVQGYKVKQSFAPVLETILNKYGDIAAACVFKTTSSRSSFLEIICEVVIRIQTNNELDNMEEIEQQLLVTEAANIDVSWLRAHLEAVYKRKEASKKCSLLVEMKTNTMLVKKAAQMDLRERCVELVAAQERFEKAEKCVRVLNLVEKNLSATILESKGGIDSWARQVL